MRPPDGRTFSLPADRAAWLTRSAGLNNLATGTQFIGLLGLVEDQVVECFRRGGGVPCSAYPRFQEVMAEDSNAVHDATMIDLTLPLVPGLVDQLRDDQARPDLMLAGIAHALRPGGVYLCVDFSASTDLAGNLDHPLGAFFYTISCMHCMTVSLAEGGMGLGTMWGEQKAIEMLGAAGFGPIETARVDGDIVNAYYICHREQAPSA